MRSANGVRGVSDDDFEAWRQQRDANEARKLREKMAGDSLEKVIEAVVSRARPDGSSPEAVALGECKMCGVPFIEEGPRNRIAFGLKCCQRITAPTGTAEAVIQSVVFRPPTRSFYEREQDDDE